MATVLYIYMAIVLANIYGYCASNIYGYCASNIYGYCLQYGLQIVSSVNIKGLLARKLTE